MKLNNVLLSFDLKQKIVGEEMEFQTVGPVFEKRIEHTEFLTILVFDFRLISPKIS